MRVLVIHAHPVETSFNRSIYTTALEALREAGHEVDALNLYEEEFQAVMSREERLIYHDVPDNLTPAVKPYVDRVLSAEGVVIIHPVWNYGYPAILKGFFDRIFIPGVSFVLENGDLRTVMRKKRVAYITTYGGDRFRTWLMGDPPRRIAHRWAWATFGTLFPPTYLALYQMDKRTEPELKAFLAKVRRVLGRF
jgi:NAD(P)H dehydrogenase (quinone)